MYASAQNSANCKKIQEGFEGMDWFLNFLTLFGGLGMFLFGMHVMGEGLEKRAGDRLRTLLEKMTAGRFRGLLLGAAVTAAIQSSSAVTVMVIGFVNSGIMTLRQSVGVIMGANVGTTITSWILSLTGIEGGGFLIRMLKPSSFVPVFAIIGVWLYVFSKRDRKRSLGQILLGFTVLIYGMEKMSDSVAPLAELPAFGEVLLLFQNPILGVLAGAALTAVLQSSSASIGILQALSGTGNLNYAIAVPVIMGQNIGTCVTSLISSVGANRNAKRAAFIHLYFNIIGTVIQLGSFSVARLIFSMPFLVNPVTPASIAVIHTIFNLLSTLILLPFSKGLEKVVVRTVRGSAESDADPEPLLDKRLLTAPTIAVAHSREVTVAMAGKAFANVKIAIGMLSIYKEENASALERNELAVDRMEDEIGTYLVRLGSKNVNSDDGALASGLLRIIGDLERISDHAVKIGLSAKELFDKKLSLPTEDQREMGILIGALEEIAELTCQCFAEGDLSAAERVEPICERIDLLQKEIRIRHINRMRESGGVMAVGFVLSDLLNEIERIADHCVNVSGCVIEIAEKRMRIHAYLRRVRSKSDGRIQKWRDFYEKKYSLTKNDAF
jgi:phosphate:Na+ symporter